MDELTEFIPQIVKELSISPRQIQAVVQLLDDGATIPFIARYRKEVHGNLDEVQIGSIQERILYYREFAERRSTILKSIEDQEKLTDELRAKIMACLTKTELEDLYLPYKPKRRTRAMIAKEKGLEPLAEIILQQGNENPDEVVKAFLTETIATQTEAFAGARDIVAERIAENAEVRGFARDYLTKNGIVTSEVVDPPPTEPTKFEQYYKYEEAISKIPSHRFLAIRRGETEKILRSRLSCDSAPIINFILETFLYRENSTFAAELKQAAEESYKRLISPSVEIDVAVELKLKSDRTAIDVFAENLRYLLLQAPLGEKTVLAIDPGIRTGCKTVALDSTGKFLKNITIFPGQNPQKEMESAVEICKLISKFHPDAIAVGNGTAGRETEAFVRKTLAKANAKEIIVVSVSESGASVYSASEIAREEFPELDLTVRGAISIGRRLQDPLAELVKIDPKAIGVGQYQHDVSETMLAQKLDDVVVSCVNLVGVELNTASAALLTRVAGVGPSIAKKIVAYRNEHGAFQSRKDLLKVPGLGAKTFEQAAGFLRIQASENPLDHSAVHPERYGLVEQMAKDSGVKLSELIGNNVAIAKIPLAEYISDDVGELTLRDIIAELKKPGRDPRATFEPPAFRDDIVSINDVTPGMTLEGVVTNVTAFGAFVDIGVHQDGLVHISELCNHYVKDPAEVVKTGDKLKVKVLSVDLKLKRISLSAKTKPTTKDGNGNNRQNNAGNRNSRPTKPQSHNRGFSNNPFAGL